MAKQKHAKSGRPTKGEGPKLSTPEEVEFLATFAAVAAPKLAREIASAQT